MTSKRRVTFDPSTFAEKPGPSTSEILPARGNAYVDQLLELIGNGGEEVDPYVIEDGILKFDKNFLLFEVQLLDGQLTGLRTLQRSGFCYLSETKDVLRIGAIVEAGALSFRFKSMIKCMNFGPTLTVHVNVSFVEVFFSFSFHAETGSEAILHSFRILDLNGVDVQVTGLGFLTWSLNILFSNVAYFFKSHIKTFIENNVKTYVSELLPTLKFPAENSDDICMLKTKPRRALGKVSLKETGKWKNGEARIYGMESDLEMNGFNREKIKSTKGLESEIQEEKAPIGNGQSFQKSTSNGKIQHGIVRT